MGKVEKIVVLGVALVVVVILVISTQGNLTTDQGETAAAERSPDVVHAGETQEGAPGGQESAALPAEDPLRAEGGESPGAPDETAPEGLSGVPSEGLSEALSESSGAAGVASSPDVPVYEVPEDLPGDWDLVTLAGLSDHLYGPDLKVYTAAGNDTLTGIAARYYGDEAFVVALERNNEGVNELSAGQQILLPVVARHILDEPRGEYEVQSGESLWKIAKKVYGAGHRWGEIYEANRQVLASPEALSPGIVLRIP